MDGLSDDELWAGLAARVRATVGDIGISKALGSGSEVRARSSWLSAVRPMITALSARLPVDSTGPALLSVGDGVTVQLNLQRVVVLVDETPRIQTSLAADPGASVLALVAHERWGADWDAFFLGNGTSRPIVKASSAPMGAPDVLEWVAQNPHTPGPWSTGASAEDARLTAVAEDAGYSLVATLFDDFMRGKND